MVEPSTTETGHESICRKMGCFGASFNFYFCKMMLASAFLQGVIILNTKVEIVWLDRFLLEVTVFVIVVQVEI